VKRRTPALSAVVVVRVALWLALAVVGVGVGLQFGLGYGLIVFGVWPRWCCSSPPTSTSP
jgi:hypothetical protein